MILLGNFLIALGQLLNAIITLFIFVLIARAVLSWVNPDPNNGIVQFIYGITDPLLRWFRRYIPPIGMFDLSLLIAIFVLYFLQTLIVNSLLAYGHQLLPLSGL